MLVDGKKIAKTLEEKLITELLFSSPKKVCFVVFGGNERPRRESADSATEQFVKMKTQVAERAGIAVVVKKFQNIKTTKEAAELVREIGESDCDGIVVQLPLPPGIDVQAVLDEIPPLKDIDILGSVAKESYAKEKMNRNPPVAQAVREILEVCNVKLAGKKIVVAGAGRLVGEPVCLMLKRMKAPYDVIDINTNEKEKLALFKNADIIISGMGVPHAIKPEMVKKGVVLIDAGTSEQVGKLVGDINPACAEKASFMTPVPGGVGPITIVSLLRNLM